MPNRWVTGALILTVISLLGSAIVISQVAQGGGGSGNEISATCPSMQYATGENKSGNFLCGSASNTNYLTSALTTQTAVSTEAAAMCPVRQYATGENSDGSFVCGSASNTNYLTTQTLVSTEVAATCPVSQYATGENTNGSLNCGSASNTNYLTTQTVVSTEAAATCNFRGRLVINESANGSVGCSNFPAISDNCHIGTFGAGDAGTVFTMFGTSQCKLQLAHPHGITAMLVVDNNATVSGLICANTIPGTDLLYIAGQTYTSTSCFTFLPKFQAIVWTNGTNNWYGIVSSMPNINFQNNAKTCTDTTSGTTHQMGFKLNYTATETGKASITINFQIASPATSGINTKFQVSFGSTTAPACNAATTGSTVGNQYEMGTFAATASFEAESLTVGILTLTPGTTYWFDIQALDSSTASWIYSNPQMTVMES